MDSYFIEREPKERRYDSITGRPLRCREGAVPYNRKNPTIAEMDEFFC